jgi:hypothetical protein
LLEVVRGKLPSNATVKEYVNTAGSALLAPHFADLSPEYPVFSVLVTRQIARRRRRKRCAGSLEV